jgi:Skp family chaperone for outer membrane proteins
MVAAGVAILCGGIYTVSRLSAQPPAGQPAAQPPASPEPRTRVALINLSSVIKNYGKFKAFQDEMKKSLEVYQERDKTKAGQIETCAKELGDAKVPPAPERKEQLEREIKKLQREREDNSAAAKEELAKKSDTQMVILYKEVMEATQRYAVAHNFELVLHYNDATTLPEYWSPANVMRKMQAGACMPLYAVPGMDISKQVEQTLNASYHPAAQPVTTAPTTGGTSHP